MDPQPTAPPVVAVVVTSDPGPWLEETLASLGAQDYPNLSVLVIDAASAEDPTPRVAEVLPNAFVRRLPENPGWSAAANHVLDMVEGAAFYAFVHDDAAPEPDAIRLLVEEALRSNVGIVGCKLVQWDDRERLLQVGVAVDRMGATASLVERGELDQEQHDAVRDVFAVPGGCTVVRNDLFVELQGFDPVMTRHGEDVDLCWRAQVVGARVLVAPSARVRHLEALPLRGPQVVDDRRRLQTRHRIRTMLKCYGPLYLLAVVPLALAVGLAEVVYSVLAGRRGQAGDVISAWTYNVRGKGGLREARRATQRLRRVRDSDVRRLQMRGSARATAFVRGQLGGGGDRAQTLASSGRALLGSVRKGPRRASILVWTLIVLVLLVGSRGLLAKGLPAVGQLGPFPDHALVFFGKWTSGWRFSGLGSTSPQPTAFALLGLAGYALFGGMGLLQKILVVGAIPIGIVGAWRLARPLAHSVPGARLVAAVFYGAVPVAYNALARGRWGGLIAYAALPYLLGRLLAASGLEPFGDDARPLRQQALALGLLLGLVGALVPALAVLVVVIALALTVGSVFAGRLATAARTVPAAAGAIVVAGVLCVPWTLGFLVPGAQWATFAGAPLAPSRALGLGALLRFETGPIGAAPLGWAFVVAAALPLLIGRDWRLAWAVRLWAVALACVGLVWASGRGWLPLGLPTPEVVLAAAAVALALAAALGLVAFRTDLPGYRFGWRQAASVVAAAAVVGVIPVVAAAGGGRWHLARNDQATILAWMKDERARGGFRVLWLGDPEVLPMDGWPVQDGLAYAVSRDGTPTATDLWPASSDGATELIPDALTVARRDGTTRLGHLLSPMAVRYVVVANRVAPDGWTKRSVPPWLPRSLAAQVDLRHLASDASLLVYENTAWAPSRAELPAGVGTDPSDAASAELAGAKAVLRDETSTGRWVGPVARGRVLLSEASSPRWRLQVDGRRADRERAFGWANVFGVDRAGKATLSYRTPLSARVLLLLQILLWAVAIRLAIRDRRRHLLVGQERR